jgi:hypothetical protein
MAFSAFVRREVVGAGSELKAKLQQSYLAGRDPQLGGFHLSDPSST